MVNLEITFPEFPVDFDLIHASFDDKDYISEEGDRKLTFERHWKYYDGIHKKFLKVKAGEHSFDDNVVVNFCGVLVDRTVARLFGDPSRNEFLSFDVERKDEEARAEAANVEDMDSEAVSQDTQDEVEANMLLQEVWDRSGGLVKLLTKSAVFGSIAGHFIYRLTLEENGPRIIALDPALFGILTREDDKDKITAYKIEYEVKRRDPTDPNRRIKTVDFRQLIVHGPDFAGPDGWYIRDFINWRKKNHPKPEWSPVSEVEVWDVCPIVEGQNLPHAKDIWGRSDMGPVIGLNDEVNFLLSNVNRIVRYHAHPRTVAIGVDPDSVKETGIEQFWAIPASPDQVKIQNLEMESDLGAVFNFFQTIREAFWTIGREADPATFKDKIGNVTNFGLRVLFLDALNKLSQKRETYRKALTELSERIFHLEGLDNLTVDLKWSDSLPSDPREEVETLMLELDARIISRETAARERGRNWPLESKRILQEAQERREMDIASALSSMRGEDEGELVRPRTDRRNLDE